MLTVNSAILKLINKLLSYLHKSYVYFKDEEEVLELLSTLEKSYPEERNIKRLKDRIGEDFDSALAYCSELELIRTTEGGSEIKITAEGMNHLYETKRNKIERKRKVIDTLAAAFLVSATTISAIATIALAGVSTTQANIQETQTNIEKLRAATIEPQANCGWKKENDSMTIYAINHGGSPYQIIDFPIEGHISNETHTREFKGKIEVVPVSMSPGEEIKINFNESKGLPGVEVEDIENVSMRLSAGNFSDIKHLIGEGNGGKKEGRCPRYEKNVKVPY